MVKERIVHFQFPSNSTSVLNHDSKYFLQNISGLFSITILQQSYIFKNLCVSVLWLILHVQVHNMYYYVQFELNISLAFKY